MTSSSEGQKLIKTINGLSSLSESQLRNCTSIADVFGPDQLLVRVRLKDHALKLIRLDPASTFARGIDVIWQKCVYSPISACRSIVKKNKGDDCFDKAMIQSHLTASIGVFSQIDLLLDQLLSEEKPKKSLKSFTDALTFKLNMCMGDLHRYLVDFSISDKSSNDAKLAQQFYLRAHEANEKSGAPFNQLAVLASINKSNEDEPKCVDIAFFALKSLTSPEQSELAMSNLRSLLKKNDFNMEKVIDKNDEGSEMRKCNLLFGKIIKNVVDDDNKSGKSAEKIQASTEAGRQWLKSLETCLYNYNEDDMAQISQVSNFAADQVLKMTVSLVLTLHLPNTTNSSRSMVRALLLALFLQLLTKYTGDICAHLRGPEAVVDLFEDKDDLAENKERKKDAKKGKGRLGMLRRRRRRGESDESDVSKEDESGDSSDQSSDEESLHSGASNESVSEIEESDDSLNTSSEDDSSSSNEKEEDKNDDKGSIVTRHELNSALRLCCIWLKHEKLDEKSVEALSILFRRLKALFGLLENHFSNNYYVSNDSEEKRISFVEDRLLPQYLESPSDAKNYIDANAAPLEARLFHWRRFQNWLSKIEGTGIAAVKQQVSKTLTTETTKSTTETAKNTMERATTSKLENRELMESMAQLWLQHEVKGLESGAKSDSLLEGLAHYRSSPYIIIDHLALIRHLGLVERVVECKRFAVIVPTIVVSELDRLKGAHQSARLAIRWLERQFQYGNRWLRSQRIEERLRLDDNLYPERTNRRIRCWLSVIECCNHFASLIERKSEAIKITCLTGVEIDEDQTEDKFDVQSLAGSIGMRMENVDVFVKHALGPRSRQQRCN